MPDQVRTPFFSLMAARSSPGDVIGLHNRLPWRLKSDLRRLKQLTTDHVVIMGRMTFESIGRPLPNRANVVLSSRALPDGGGDLAEGTEIHRAAALNDALRMADVISASRKRDEIFVLGGQTIYDLFLKEGLIDRIYLTEVFADVQGDAHFRTKFPENLWVLLSTEDILRNDDGDEYNSRFSIYEKRE